MASAPVPTLFRENDMRGSVRRNMLDRPVSQSTKIDTVEERFSSAKGDRSKSKVDFVHVAGLNVLPYSLSTAANLDILCARRFARLLQRKLNAIGNKVKCRSAQHLDRWTWIMRQDESWRVIRRVVPPPTFPLIARPFPTNGSEHVATENEGAETFHCPFRELVVEACFSTLFSLHPTKCPRREKPLEEFLAMQAKRMIQALIDSRSETIERDTEPRNFHLRH